MVPDAGDFAAEVDAAVGESQVAVQVPVVPDTEGFQLLIDQATEEAKTEVTVPVVPDMAGFAAEAETTGAEAGTEAGTAFADRFTVAASMEPLSPGMAALAAEEAGTAGEAAGAAFSEKFAAAADSAALFPAAGVERDAEVAAEESATGFGSRFSSLLAGIPLLGGMIPGVEKEAAAAGENAGSSFMGSLKGIISGDLPVMETLLGAGFVAATAVMASKFQAAMELIHTQAGVAQSAIAGLSGGVLSLAGQVGESPDSLAAALYHVESSFQSVGISGSKALSLVQIAAEGARTGNADLVDVTNALDATIVSGVGGIHSYSQAMGALNAIVGTGDMTMQNLADAMGTGLMAAGKAYGQSIYQIGAALATLGDNNIRGAKAATDLRMAWQAVEAPLKTGIGTLNNLGLTQSQLANEMTQHGLTSALQLFVDHLESSKVPVNQWGQIVTEVFGKRAGVGIQVLIDQLDRLQGKLPDIENAAHNFGNAWASTQQTTSQKLHELEGSFESLAVRIGGALLPSLNAFMGWLNSSLPGVEHFAGILGHIAQPLVKVFFTELGGTFRTIGTEVSHAAPGLEKFAESLVKAAVPMVKTFFTQLSGVLRELGGDIVQLLPHLEKIGTDLLKVASPLVSLFFTGLGGILKLLLGPLKDVTIGVGLFALGWKALTLAMDMDPFVAIGTAIVILAGLVIKYHKQILDVIEKTWGDISRFVEKIWDDLVKFAKSHWLELLLGPVGLIVQYHNDIFKFIQGIWNDIYGFFSQIIGEIISFFETSWDTIWGDIKKVWGDIEQWFTTWWNNEVAGWEKIVTTVEGWLKTAWNTIWGDIKTAWNTISGWFTTWWNNEVAGWEKIVTTLEGWLVTAWDTIKTDAVTGFDNVRHAIAHIWDEIVQDIEGFIATIETKIAGIGKTVISLPGKLLGDIGLASGGVLPGYAPGHDSINAKLSPGEAVLVPEAVRAIGPDRINAINAAYAGGRSSGGGHYAAGGLIPGGLSPYAAGAAAGSAMQMSSYGQAGASTINNFYLSFSGSRPTGEEWQAIQMKLSAAVGVA